LRVEPRTEFEKWGLRGRTPRAKGAVADRPYLADMNSLKREFRERGFYEPPTALMAAVLSVHVLLIVLGSLFFGLAHGWTSRTGGIFLSAAGLIGVATNAHTWSHYAGSRTKWVNELVTYFGSGVVVGISTTY
jgi:fatty acid desaturase